MVILVAGGLLSLTQLNKEQFPDVELGVVQVSVPYLGAAPEEVEEGVCSRIEEALESAESIFRMTSSANEGSYTVTLEIELGSDTVQALNEIKSNVDSINTFPEETERPIISEMTILNEVLHIVISGETDERTLKQLAMNMREDLVAIEGVSQVAVEYVRPDEISIEVSEQTLRRYGLTLQEVADAVRRSSLDLPGGSIKAGGGEILLRTKGQAYQGSEFESIVVVTRGDGTAVTLGEIARVVDGFEEGDLQVRLDGKPAAMVKVYRIANEDSAAVSEKSKAYLENARSEMPEGIELSVWLDEAQDLKEALNTILGVALGGLVLVLIALTLPLQFRLAMWVAAGIPIALLGGIMTFDAFGITMSLLATTGFMLVLGIVVDDAIVVGERIYSYERSGENQRTAAINGAYEMLVPVVFGVLTTIAAFLPLIFTPGRMGAFFSIIGKIVVICLIFSVIECLLILPSHLAHRKKDSDPKNQKPFVKKWVQFQSRLGQGLENFSEQHYGNFLRKVLEKWRYVPITAGLGITILMLAMFFSGRIDFQFMPPIEGNRIYASLTMPEGIPVEDTVRAAEQIEQAALQLKAQLDSENPDNPSAVLNILTSIGKTAGRRGGGPRARSSFTSGASHLAEVSMSLVPISERNITSLDIASRWRELTGPVADVIELRYSAVAFNTGDAISINLRGQNVDQLGEAAAQVRAELSRFTSVTDISDSFRSGKQEARLSLRPEARHLGLTLNDLARQVRQAFYGEEAQRIQRGTEDVRAMVRYPELDRRSLGDLEDMRIRTATGSEVPFAAVAEVDFGTGFSTIRRVDRQRIVTVTADVDRSMATPQEIIDTLEAEVLPSILLNYRGMSYYLGGEHEEGIEAFSGLASLIPLALMVMFSLLAIPLKSYAQPLVIMSVIPFGAVGALAGHLIMGWPVVMSSILGIISLSGVVVNASLVLVHYINRLRRQGVSIDEATVQASIVRFRPIMLASLTTFLGLVPLMLSNNPNTAFVVPMAISLGWGVLFATMMTLFLVPSLYLILEDLLPAGWFMDKSQTETVIHA